MVEKKGDRANGLQDAGHSSDIQPMSLPMYHDCKTKAPANADSPKEESANASNPNRPDQIQFESAYKGNYGQNDRVAKQPEAMAQETCAKQQWPMYNQQEQLWQDMQPTKKMEAAAVTSANLVGNGLPQTAKTFTPFELKNSPLLANNPNADLQQNSMANGLLQNQQKNATPLDNTWSGEVTPASMPEEEAPTFDVIEPTSPGKPPQFIMRGNYNNTSLPDIGGFPQQRSQPKGHQRMHIPGGGMSCMGMQQHGGMPYNLMSPMMGSVMPQDMGHGMTPDMTGGMGAMMQHIPPAMTTYPSNYTAMHQGVPQQGMPMMSQGVPQVVMHSEMVPQVPKMQPAQYYPYGAQYGNAPAYHPYGVNGGTMCQNYS